MCRCSSLLLFGKCRGWGPQLVTVVVVVRSPRLRIWLRDGPNCAACGELIDITPGTARPFELDHTIPLWAGGKDIDSNRQCLCPLCHAGKTAREAAERAQGWRE